MSIVWEVHIINSAMLHKVEKILQIITDAKKMHIALILCQSVVRMHRNYKFKFKWVKRNKILNKVAGDLWFIEK